MQGFTLLLSKLVNSRIFAGVLVAISLVLGGLTFSTFSGYTPSLAHPDRLKILIYLDLVFLLTFGIFVIYRLVKIWSNRRRGSAGARLHLQFMVMFGAVAALPTIIIAVFSILFFNLGLESWFSERVRTAVLNSKVIAQAYLQEHRSNIRGDTLRIARDLSRDAIVYDTNDQRLARALSVFSEIRGISDAIVFEPGVGVRARLGIAFSLGFDPDFDNLPDGLLESAGGGDVVITADEQGDLVYGLVKLDGFFKSYLMVARSIDPTVLGYSENTAQAVRQFEVLESQRSDIQISFIIAFAGVALLLLLASIWVGLNFATRMSSPISRLIVATEKVRAGDLTSRVPDQTIDNEIGMLSRAFNRMADQLSAQRQELLEANYQLDERRRFTETVLTGVSAGVVGLDANGRIELPNRRASILLGVDLDEMIGHELSDLVPKLRDILVRQNDIRPSQFLEQQLELTHGAETRLLLVKLGAEFKDDKVEGFVLTLDDITALLKAQTQAAWSDVARRIAHEIKNPLTPIQLSAERLKRRYTKMMDDGKDREIFETCTDTIIRQVDSLEKMVNEFSNFARMPAPVIEKENLSELCKQAMFLERSRNTGRDYDLVMPDEPIFVMCDGRQISQVMVNLLKNSDEALSSFNFEPDETGRIALKLSSDPTLNLIHLDISDNGAGFPKEGREKLLEPYITNKESGTGLGLAIARKIMEDHDGTLRLLDNDPRGAQVRLTFPMNTD